MFLSGSVKIEQPGSQPTVSSELVPGAQNTELIGRLQYPTFLPSDFTVSQKINRSNFDAYWVIILNLGNDE